MLKVLLRNVTTDLYLDLGTWVPLEKAYDFEVVYAAYRFALTHKLANVEIVEHRPDSQEDTATGALDFSTDWVRTDANLCVPTLLLSKKLAELKIH